jgi:hypothetical protein
MEAITASSFAGAKGQRSRPTRSTTKLVIAVVSYAPNEDELQFDG